MEKKVISFLGGLNKDDNGLNFPEGDYKSANNIIIETDEDGNGVAIKKMNSTHLKLSNTATHLLSSEYVQSCVDLDNSIYVLLKGMNTSGDSVATIVKLRPQKTRAGITNFTSTNIITSYDYQGCRIKPDMCIVGDRLIWNFMGDGIPMMIQTSLRDESPTLQELTLIKAPPIYQLKTTEISGDSVSVFTDNQYQFAARYVYNDSEVSVLGPISPLSSGVEFVKEIQVDLNESEVHPLRAKSVEYYVRDGNNGVWFLIDNLRLNSPTVITFSGIKSVALPTLVSSKQFDSVPFATKNVESVNNLIFLGNNLETLPLGGGETTIDTADISMDTFSASITSVAISDRGFYTSAPTISISGGEGSGGSLTAVVSVGGSGYTSAPTVTIASSAYSQFSSSATATATATVSGGVVTSINITNAGLYPSPVPTLTISGGGGSGAFAKCVTTKNGNTYRVSSIVIAGPVNSITINNAGSGYTSPPTISFTQDALGGRASASATIADADYVGGNYAYYKSITPLSTGYKSDGYDKGFDTDIEDETKPFANGSTYEVGYVLFDEYMRTRGVEGIKKFTTTEFGFNKKSISIYKQSNFPSWAKYFQLAITKNLTKDFIYEGYADTCYFIAEPSIDNSLSPITAIRAEGFKTDQDGNQSFDYTSDTNSVRVYNDDRGLGNTDKTRVTALRGGGGSVTAMGNESTSTGNNRRRRSGGRRAGGGVIGGQDRSSTYTKGVTVTVNTQRADEITKSAVMNPVPFLPKTGLKASDIRDKIKYFAVDIAGMFATDRFYTFQEGDQIIGNFINTGDNNISTSFQTLKILSQDGSLIYCDPSPIINATELNEVERNLYFEIYSPADSNQTSVFYGNRDVYPIGDLDGNPSDSKTFNLEGDCYYSSITLPSGGGEKMLEEANTYKSTFVPVSFLDLYGNPTATDNSVVLTISSATEINNVAKSILASRYTTNDFGAKKDVAPELWELDLGNTGDIIINAEGLYTFDYSADFSLYHNNGGTPVFLSDNIQVGLLVNGETVRYADFQQFTTATTGPTTFSSLCSVYLYAGDKVSISHQKSDEHLSSYSTYYIDGINYSITISKDAIATTPFAKKYRRGETTVVIDDVTYTPPDKPFIIKALSRSGKIQTQWNKDYGKPYIKYEAPAKSEFIKNRVRYSGSYIDGGASSSLSSFLFDDYTDLPAEVASINALVRTSDQQSQGTVVLAMGDRNTFSLYINRGMLSTANGENLTTQSNQIISQIYPLKGGFGCKDKMSIIRKEGKVFYYDRIEKVYVRYAREGLEPIADKMQNYFKHKSSVKAAYYDPFYDMIFVNFNNLKTAAYSDKLKRWISEYDMAFTGSFYLDNNAYLFSKNDSSRTELYETRTGTNYGNFLGAETVAKIKLTSNSILPVNVGHIQIKTKNWLDFTSI